MVCEKLKLHLLFEQFLVFRTQKFKMQSVRIHPRDRLSFLPCIIALVCGRKGKVRIYVTVITFTIHRR